MTLQELVGQYSVIGSNQDIETNTYKGSLNLALDEHHRIKAKWMIIESQEQFGYGFFKNNILVINFKYKSDNSIFKSVVVYNCISKDLLEGFWSKNHGDPSFIREERCFRTDRLKEVIN